MGALNKVVTEELTGIQKQSFQQYICVAEKNRKIALDSSGVTLKGKPYTLLFGIEISKDE